MDIIPFAVRVKIMVGLVLGAVLILALALLLSRGFGDQTPQVQANVSMGLNGFSTTMSPSPFPSPSPSPMPTQTPFVYDFQNFFPPAKMAENPPHPDNLVTPPDESLVGSTPVPTETLIPFLHYYEKTQTAQPPAEKTAVALTKTPQPGLAAGVTCEIRMNGVMTPVDCKEWGLDRIAGMGGRAKDPAISNEAGNPDWANIPPARGSQREEIVSASWYNPALLGTNCGLAIGGICVSNMASGLAWLPWMHKAIACAPSWPFYTRVIFPDGSERVCLDRGGAIKYVNGVAWIDMLETRPVYPFGTLVRVTVIFP